MKFVKQKDQMDCGPACLSMVASIHGKKYSLEYLRENSFINREGVSLLGIVEASNTIGFETLPTKITIEELVAEKETLPAILHWNQNHFVVLHKITNQNSFIPFSQPRWVFHIADPAHGFIKLKKDNFKKHFISDNKKGVTLFLSPTETFYNKIPPKINEISLRFLFDYLKPFKKQLMYMFVMMFLGSLASLLLPFLTQNLIDKGIQQKSVSVISMILFGQLAVFIGSLVFDLIRNRILLFVGSKISINIISDFLQKLLQLPLKYFDTKLMGDFNQRIQDNERIEHFLTSQSLITFFSIITFSVFFGVLWWYNINIMLLYTFLTTLAIIWSFYWLKKRRILDYFRFQHRSENQESIYEIINGVTEMKLNDFENLKREEWKNIQLKLFDINLKVLKLDQLQTSGFDFINQLKNILVTFLSAILVIKSKMTLGELLSVSYIVGQMNTPVNQLVSFIRSLQDAKLSLERLNEVQNHQPEETHTQSKLENNKGEGIQINNLSYQYEGPKSPFVLKDINFTIPDGKITAIVGASGSGKTTLMKLLLRFYEPINGTIKYNNQNILNLSPKDLRKNCGTVIQDGYIFSDTIERNIATGDVEIDYIKLEKAIEIANISQFIKSLPLTLKTKIGASGNGISGGQKQRILIARAVYKNPHYIFFDEATSALDAENEKIIHDNLQRFFKGKTVLIIAHRLSTVKNANQIIVFKNGEIAEIGNHEQLVNNRADYYNLVKNQLELGN